MSQTPPPAASRRLTRDQKIARLRDELAREISREKEEKRRQDTRQKILLGGAVLALLNGKDLPPVSKHNLVGRLLPLIAEKDRADISALLSALLPPSTDAAPASPSLPIQGGEPGNA